MTLHPGAKAIDLALSDEDAVAVAALPARLPAAERARFLVEVGAAIEAAKAVRPVEVITAPGSQFGMVEIERVFVVYTGERPVIAGEQ